jgi:hypothetical protein
MAAEEIRTGSYPELGFPPLLHDLVRNLATGRLDVREAGGERHLWLEAGQVRAVVSEVEEEKLGKWLSTRGVLEADRMAISLLQQPEGVRYGTFLVQQGLLDADRLTEELGALAVEITSRLLFAAADYRLDPADRLPSDVGSVEMSTATLLAAAARAVKDPSQLGRFADPWSFLCTAQDALLLNQKATLTPQEGFLLSRADGSLTVGRLRGVLGLPPKEVDRATAVLVIAGVAELRDVAARRGGKREPAPPVEGTGKDSASDDAAPYTPQQAREYSSVTRLAAECRQQDLYDRLGLSPGSTQDQVHSRFLEFARHYHPDRAGEPHLRSLRSELAVIYSALKEAHDILSSPELRARYDASGAKPKPTQGTDDPSAQRRAEARAELVRANVTRAKEAIRTSDFGTAVQLLDQAVRLEPQAEALLLLARLEFRNPMWTQRALDHLKHAVAVSPNFTEAWIELANYWGLRGRLERQRQCFGRILQYDPDNAEAKAALASSSLGAKKSPKAS